jgi:CHAD domain-containing protein
MLVSFPELQAFYRFLAKQERQLTRSLSTELKRVKTRKLRKRIAAAIRELETLPHTSAVQRAQRTVVLLAIDTAYNRVIERKQTITPSDGASIHRMRVAFKKFRYMVEVIGPLRGRTSNRQLKAMNAFQGLMGDIQDAEVLLHNVRLWARRRDLKGRAPLARALEELSRRRMEAIATFLEAADTVFTFWQPSSKIKGGQ